MKNKLEPKGWEIVFSATMQKTNKDILKFFNNHLLSLIKKDLKK